MNDHNVHSIEAQRRRIAERIQMTERAKVEAHRLRAEAFTALVVGADGLIRGAALRAARATNRLAARLRQHGKQRVAVAES
jgi:hypothetical protein